MVVAGVFVAAVCAVVLGLSAVGQAMAQRTGHAWARAVPYAILAWAGLTAAMWERRGKR